MSDHYERREYNLKMSEDIGLIKGMLEGLSGPQGRVTALEEQSKTAEKRQWLHTCVIVPLVGAAHVIAHKIGW